MAIKTFTAGEVLTASDTNTFLANSGLVYVDTVTWSSGAATQSFDGKFTSTYTNYKIILNLDATNNDVLFTSKMRASGSPTSTNYKWVNQNQYVGMPALGIDGSNSATFWQLGTISDTETSGILEIFKPKETKRTIVAGMLDNIQTAFSNGIYWFEFRGHINDTTSYDGMEFTVAAGTFTGSATIYGYRIA